MKASVLPIAMTMALSMNVANAITVSIDPLASTVNLGSSVDVNLIISDLGSFASPSLGSFVLEVAYDDSILSFDSVVYSNFLGTGFDVDIFTTTGVGFVELDSFSYLSNVDLDGLQDSSFLLATLSFNGLNAGLSHLMTTPIDFSTAAGTDITSSVLVTNATVEVLNVPEPSSQLLMFSSLLLLGGFKYKTRQS